MNVTPIPCIQITPGNNDRKVFDPEQLQRLADSILQAGGLAQPITVRPIGPDRYEIVAGERRFRAISQVLSWPTIDTIVRTLTDEEASAIMLSENTSRKDLNPIEEADAYRSRMQRFGWSPQATADRAGVSVEVVQRRLLLLNLRQDIQQLISTGNLPLAYAEIMSRLDDYRQTMALRIFQEGRRPSPGVFRAMVNELLEEQCQDSLIDLTTFYIEQMQAEQESDRPRMGKKAVTGAPERRDLPAFHATQKDTIPKAFDRYIHDLLRNGFQSEAEALGTFYNSLVRSNYMSAPVESMLIGQPGQ